MDVVIIGGGVVGCATALWLRRRGIGVRVLEKSVPGAEASSAAAGMLSAQVHAEPDSPTLELALRAAGLHARLADELRETTGLDVGYRRTGALDVTFDDARGEALHRRVRWQANRGLRAEWADADGVRALEPSVAPTACAGAFFPDDAQVDSPVFARAISLAARAAGAEFVSGDPVRRIVVERGRAVAVETQRARHDAGTVVLAAGAWSSLVDGAGLQPGSVRPARGQIVELRAPTKILRRVLWSDRGYVVPKSDGRVICGSTIEDAGYEKAVTAEGVRSILQNAIDLVPDLARAEVSATWSGFRPVTDDALPLIGRGRFEGLVLATGHFTSGILLAPATAEAVAAIVIGERTPVDVSAFDPRRLERAS